MEDIVIRARVKADLSELKTQLKGLSVNLMGGDVRAASPRTSAGAGTPEKKGGTGGALASIAGTAMKKTAGAITGGLMLVLDKFLDPLLDVAALLGLIIISLASFLSIAGAIFGVILGLSVISKGIFDSFRDVGRILGVISSLIGKMVAPFVNLLIPLMIPVLYVLGTMAKMFNMLVRPLFALMMKVFAQPAVAMAQLVAQLIGGQIDLSGFISAVGALFQNAISAIVSSSEFQAFAQQFGQLLQLAVNALKIFLEMDMEQVKAAIAPLLGPQLADAVTGVISIFHYLISAVAGFIAQMVGGENFDKWMGKGEFDKLKSGNAGFSTGVDIASAMQGLYDAVMGFVPLLLQWIDDFAGDPIGTILTTFTELSAYLTETALPLIKQWIEGTITLIMTEFDAFMKEQWPEFRDSFGNWVRVINDWVTAMDNFDPVGWLKDQIDDWLDGQESMGSMMGYTDSGHPLANDFVMRPGQGPVGFSPSDTIIGTKNPGALLGGGGGMNVSITINGTALSERQLQSAIEDAMESAMAKQSRNGAFQKGF